ncbi:uncharacterized protein DS421_16g538530 [Arachis hypogaea]|nr:uncharacterized protein DS421_16g538530 [Arachis hypogaea]
MAPAMAWQKQRQPPPPSSCFFLCANPFSLFELLSGGSDGRCDGDDELNGQDLQRRGWSPRRWWLLLLSRVHSSLFPHPTIRATMVAAPRNGGDRRTGCSDGALFSLSFPSSSPIPP